MKTHKELNTSINNAIAGLTGHLASGVFYPLELIKIRLQVNEEKKVKILKLSKEIYHKEGLRGFFRGFYFSILAGEYLKNITKNKGENFSYAKQFLISYASGLFASLITLPIWTLRTRLSLITTNKTETSLNRMKIPIMLIKDSIFKEGWLNLYKGILPTIFLSLYGGIQMTIYETGKKFMKKKNLPPSYGSILGVISKLSSSIILYPFNLIRSKQQQLYSKDTKTSNFHTEIKKNLIMSNNTYGKFLETIKIIHRQSGIFGFYKGLFPLLVRQIPGSSAFFYTYEYTLKYLNN